LSTSCLKDVSIFVNEVSFAVIVDSRRRETWVTRSTMTLNIDHFRSSLHNNLTTYWQTLISLISTLALFSVSGLKHKKQTYMKTETCKLYSRVF